MIEAHPDIDTSSLPDILQPKVVDVAVDCFPDGTQFATFDAPEPHIIAPAKNRDELLPHLYEYGNCVDTKTPEIFDQTNSESIGAIAAKRICEECKVKLECLEYANGPGAAEILGIWGGLTADERASIRRARRGRRRSAA